MNLFHFQTVSVYAGGGTEDLRGRGAARALALGGRGAATPQGRAFAAALRPAAPPPPRPPRARGGRAAAGRR